MNVLGIHLTVLIGPTIPVPAPILLTDALQSVTVNENDTGPSGFQMTFQISRSGMASLVEHPILASPLLRPFNRVILVVLDDIMPTVIMDGIITTYELTPGSGDSGSTLTITGEDLSVVMDREEKNAEHPMQNEFVIVNKILASYMAPWGLIPNVFPPPSVDIPLVIERTPVQRHTDLEYVRELAARFGYVFYIQPGPAPYTSTAYWGPPKRLGLPQKALSVNMGTATNVKSLSFQDNWLPPTLVSGMVQDRLTNMNVPVMTFVSTRTPLVTQPAILTNFSYNKKVLYDGSGQNVMQAYSYAQGITDASVDNVVTATGELDVTRYGGILQARGIVGVRGAGYQHDGFYYVKSVSHVIKKGDYQQKFTLTREGLGALTPVVVP
jgi:hypothetical protein